METTNKKTLENILLVSLRSPYLDDSKIYPPLGLLYLKSAIEKELSNVNVDLCDDYQLRDIDKFINYDAIGMSIMTPQREEAHLLLNTIKLNFPNKIVIGGGPHILHYFDEVKDQKYDYLVPADGQRSLIKILKGEANRVEWDKMDKDTWKSQPRPDRSSDKAKQFLSSYHYELRGKKAGTIMTATGCPEKCRFCEDRMTTVRWSSLDNLKAEMDDMINLGYKGAYVFDDLFALSMHAIRPIISEFKKRDLIFRCNGQARYFTREKDEFAKMLSEHNCVEIAFGHETGSQAILDNIEKRTTVKQNYDSVAYAKKHGIYIKSFILLGLPGENWETLKETERFIATSGIDDFQCAVYMPFAGTKIREDIDEGKDIGLYMTVPEASGAYGIKGGETAYEVRTRALSAEDLKQFRNYLVEKYKPRAHKPKWGDKFFERESQDI